MEGSMRFELMLLCNAIFVTGVSGACTWSSDFFNSTWHDNTKGTLTFTSTEMTGYSFTAYGSTISEWECINDANFNSAGILVMKSKSTFKAFGVDWTSYLCVRLIQITDVSYYYYHLHGRQENAAEERLHVSEDGNLMSTDDTCNITTSATGSEFHVMIKQGLEEEAKIQCPLPIKGRFDYQITAADGTTFCDEANTTYHMNVCTDKTVVSYDAPCTRSPTYSSGGVFCVASVAVENSTFLAVYNPESTVDNSKTYRFSCLAISDDGLTATVVPKNCTDLQSPTMLAKDHQGNNIGASITFRPLVFCKGGCYWPAVFQLSTWRDNTKGDLSFTTTAMSGWSFTSSGSTVANWECLDASGFSTTDGGILLLKATDAFDHLGSTWVSYLCLQMHYVSPYSYYYYQRHSKQVNAGQERVKIDDGAPLTTSVDICGSDIIPDAEFHYIVKSGAEADAKQYCPPSLLKTLDYTYTGSDSSVACADSTDNWDVCTDRKIMKFDYSTCSQKIAYSASGVVWCMVNITSTYEYVVVYNTDSSLSAGVTYRFSCFVVSSDGTEASMVYDSCNTEQTPTTFAKNNGGTNIGALLTMTVKERCPFLRPSGDESQDLIPIIVGVVIGVLALAIIIAVTVYCIKRKKSNVSHIDKNVKGVKGAPVNNGTAAVVTVKDLDNKTISENPALTVEPEKNTLDPLPTKTATEQS